MKTLLVTLTLIILIFFLFQFYTFMSANKTEELKYSIIRNYKDFEIRFYPSATIATISSNAKTYKDLSGPGFRKLASYIFGGNDANKQISMTTPVQMNINDSGSTMSLVMPSAYAIENLPKPNDSSIKIQNTEDEYVALIRFGGYASDEALILCSEKLHNLLKENGITPRGNYRFFGYSPPYQLLGRRNEVIVAVDWNE